MNMNNQSSNPPTPARALARHFKTALWALALSMSPLLAQAGIYVSGSQVYEGNGNPLVLRGINVAHAWYQDKTASSLSDIANTGANSVRIVLASGQRWTKTSQTEVANLIAQAKANKLIAILEVHDTTGYGEQSGAATLSDAVNYWISIKGALVGQEDYVIINIGNEPYGNGPSADAWKNGHIAAIQSLRNAGFKHALMVDAANWGQDWQNIMRDNAASVLAADSLKNTIFSVHMYQVYGSASSVSNYMASFKSNGLALVVGEFAADHQGANVDEASIMSYAKQYNFGYLGWSWSGNSSDLVSLDIAQNFNANTLSSWGNTLINGSNGIKASSTRASIFGGATSSSSSSSIASSTSSKTSSSSAGGSQCNWYGSTYPICANSDSGWGWENNQTCVGRSSCAAQPSPYGVIGNSSSSSSSSSSKSSSSSSSSSSSTAAGRCNWYGTYYPLCTNTSSGWGWENNQSCIAPSTCNSQ